MNYHQLLSTIKTMLKIQFKHSKSVNGGARQVKGDSSVKRDFRSPSRPVNKTTPLPSLDRRWSTQISQSFNQSLMVDDFSRLVDVDLSTFDRIVMKSSSDVFVPDGGPAPLYGCTLKNARSLILTKHQIVVTFWGHFLGLTSRLPYQPPQTKSKVSGTKTDTRSVTWMCFERKLKA